VIPFCAKIARHDIFRSDHMGLLNANACLYTTIVEFEGIRSFFRIFFLASKTFSGLGIEKMYGLWQVTKSLLELAGLTSVS
jgi:hypothetical protein